MGLDLSDEAFHSIVYKVEKEKGMELAAYQPKFIVDQVIATCRFMEQAPNMNPRYIDYALDNLRVHRGTTAQSARQPEPQEV